MTATPRLGAGGLAILFAIGAIGGLIGDMCHVESGTTVYLDDSLPFVWKSQLWFPVMVGAGTAALGWIRLRFPTDPVSEAGAVREGAMAIASVLALYALTAIVRGEPQAVAVVLIYAVAVLIVTGFTRSGADLLCALIAAVFGVTTEIVLSAADVFAYADDLARFAGVASWLPALYLAYGVVAARLGLIVASLVSETSTGERP